MDLARSLALVEEQGTDLERARLRFILHRTPPDEELARFLAEIQNIDGGFPHAMTDGNLSTVESTLSALRWMDELDLREGPIAEKALGFLLDVQDEDGAWDEDRAVARYELPLWLKPGRPQTILYLTAACAFRLAVVGMEGEPAFRSALTFLEKHQEDNGKFPGALQTTWFAASVFTMDEPEGEAARSALHFLRQRPAADWIDSQLTGVLNALYPAGIADSDPLIAFCLDALEKRQQPDGSWAAEGGPGQRVDAVVETVRALLRYGRITPP